MSSAQKESREIRERIKELGDVNVGAIKEYAQVSERYQFLTEQKKTLPRPWISFRSLWMTWKRP